MARIEQPAQPAPTSSPTLVASSPVPSSLAAPLAAESVTPVSSSPAARARPAQTEISRRAHEIWVAGGSRPGRALDDWLQAERELNG